MKKLFVLLLMLLPPIYLNAQGNFLTFFINDSLKKNSNAVVRNYESVFIQQDINNATHKITGMITILNENGKNHGNIVVYLDKFRELRSFSGTISDASGKTIKKIARKDLTTTAYSPYMATDDKYSYYEYQPSGYPYTIQYEYEVRIKGGIPSYPRFIPVRSFALSVEKAGYRLKIPKDFQIRYKAEGIPMEEPVVTQTVANTVYEWSVTGFKALEREPYAPELSSLVPVLQVAPVEFCMDGYCGNMSDWNNLGKWLGKLSEGRTEISPQLKEKLVSLTADAATEKEKVQRVFEYLQKTTRYVAILLGIGGFQSMSAADVERTGFGDCKALSNYMKAMLEAIDIPSRYTVISTDRANIYPDFSSLAQMDHVILAVPLAADTLWLECTNQVLPFNYAHSNIAGHQCLFITSEGGEIHRVRRNSNIDNTFSRNFQIALDAAGNAKGTLSNTYKYAAYEQMLGFMHNMSREEQVNTLTESVKAAKTNIHDLQIRPNNSEDPGLEVISSVSMEKFANKSGNRLFIPFHVLRPSLPAIKPTERKLDIVVSALRQSDTLYITLPEEYTAESIPKPVTIETKFGNYSLETEYDNHILQIRQSVFMKPGRYPAGSATEFYAFLKDIEKESGRRAVFKN